MLASCSLLFAQRFGRCVLRPSTGVITHSVVSWSARYTPDEGWLCRKEGCDKNNKDEDNCQKNSRISLFTVMCLFAFFFFKVIVNEDFFFIFLLDSYLFKFY